MDRLTQIEQLAWQINTLAGPEHPLHTIWSDNTKDSFETVLDVLEDAKGRSRLYSVPRHIHQPWKKLVTRISENVEDMTGRIATLRHHLALRDAAEGIPDLIPSQRQSLPEISNAVHRMHAFLAIPLRCIRVNVRDMIYRDMPEVLQIEKDCFLHPWNDDDFLTVLRQRNASAHVAEDERTDRVLGFIICELRRKQLHILNIAVARKFQRLHLGSQMMAKIMGKNYYGRPHLRLKVDEDNLGSQLFCSAQGMRALRTIYPHDDHSDGVIEFGYTHPDGIGHPLDCIAEESL